MDSFPFDRYATISQVTPHGMESQYDLNCIHRGGELKQAPCIGQQMDSDHASLREIELK